MNHRHRKILHSLFAHPIAANVRFKDVEHVLTDLNATLSHSGTGRLHVELNGHKANFHTAGHDLPKEEVMQIRKYLTECGIDPERDYPL